MLSFHPMQSITAGAVTVKMGIISLLLHFQESLLSDSFLPKDSPVEPIATLS